MKKLTREWVRKAESDYRRANDARSRREEQLASARRFRISPENTIRKRVASNVTDCPLYSCSLLKQALLPLSAEYGSCNRFDSEGSVSEPVSPHGKDSSGAASCMGCRP